MRKRNAGYSLFELVILIVVLSIVCYFIFISSDTLSGERPEEMESIAAELVRIGIHNYATVSKNANRKPVYPLHLDEAEAGATASERTPLFTAVFPEGIRAGWKKVRDNQYLYMPSTPDVANEAKHYYYDPSRGTFEKGKPSPEGQLA